MKKMIALILALAMLCCVGCNKQGDGQPTTQSGGQPTTQSGGQQAGDKDKPQVDANAVTMKVNDHQLTVAEMSYFFMDSINQWYGNYGSYAAYFGLDFTKPLGEQVYDQESGETWADCFLDMAVESAKSTYALYDAAMKAEYKLSEEESKELQALYDSMDDYAQKAGFDNAEDYLKEIYGECADVESYKAFFNVTAVAGAYYSHYADNLLDGYTDDDLLAFEGDKGYNYDSFTYASVYLDLDAFLVGGTKDDSGKVTYSDEELAAAKERAINAAKQLSATDINTVEKLNTALAQVEQAMAEQKGESFDPQKANVATMNQNMMYAKVSSLMQGWLRDEIRVAGDITSLPYENVTNDANGAEVKTLEGYYVVLFLSRNDNRFPLVNVRHILAAFEGGTVNNVTGQKVFTDAEKAAAKKVAEELLEQWLAGEATEESFADLANKHSDDGDGTTGGLYEDVYPGQMVTNFNDWCFDESRKTGDYGIVESPYGYHVMFYSGDSELTYRNQMVSNDKLNADLESWQKALNEAAKVEKIALELVDTNRIIA